MQWEATGKAMGKIMQISLARGTKCRDGLRGDKTGRQGKQRMATGGEIWHRGKLEMLHDRIKHSDMR